LERGAHIVVGTPGRCLDHLLRKTISFSEVKTVVLDEADRMLDMGFEEDMEKLLGALNRKRQTVLFSATFPQEIEKISRAYQKQPQRVTVESADENKPKIEQLVYVCPPEQKSSAVIGVLEHYQPHSSIVFCNTKLAVARLARELVDAGIRAVEIHGDRLQSERDRAMAKFRNGTARVLVATDVAARGIDIQGLDAVICFEPTPQPEVHTHRIGRTGRAGREGLAILLITEQERHRFDQIKEHTGGKFLFRSLDDLGRGGSEIRSKSNGEIERANPSTAAPPVAMETLWISGGRKQKVRPGDLLGALTGEAGRLRADQVGKIEIHDNFSYVAIHQSESARVINELRNGQIKGRKFRVERVR
jgi:ATP-independent RNA helicase DbpA